METADLQAPTKLRELKIAEPPTVSDPWQLMDKFYSSESYKRKFQSFYEGKSLAPDVTEKEKEKTFLESESAEYALIKFGSEEVNFRFDKGRYPQEFLNALSEYRKTVKGAARFDRGLRSNEEILALDSLRFDVHTDCARALVRAGIAPTLNTGRAITGLILASEGLESKEDVQRTTLAKIKSRYAVAA